MGVIGDREPFSTRESAVLGALAQFWGVEHPKPLESASIILLTSDEPDLVGGRCLSDPMTTRLEIAAALSALGFDQVMILRHRVVDRDSPHGIAQQRKMDLGVVHDEIRDALQTLVRIIFADLDVGQPLYVSGPHVKRVKRPETHWQDEPPTFQRPSRGHQSKKMNRRIAAMVRRGIALHESQGVYS